MLHYVDLSHLLVGAVYNHVSSNEATELGYLLPDLSSVILDSVGGGMRCGYRDRITRLHAAVLN
jgi:hypothetical protein